MKTALLTAKATLLALLTALSGCSGSQSDAVKAASGPMYIESCSLGCGNAAGDTTINCSLVNISQNSEITVLFSQPVNLATVNASTFRIVNLNNGTVPDGVFTISPSNPRLLVFRPSLTFTGSGIPEFGFEPNETYRISIQGSLGSGTGPYIESMAGKQNATILDCTVQTVLAPIDPVPGQPTVTAYVTSTFNQNTGEVEYGGTGNLPLGGSLLTGAADIPLKSKLVLVIDDVMNKSTIANQLTGQSATIDIVRENTTGDPLVQAGRWDVSVDYDNLLRTVAVFTPTTGSIDPETGLPDENFLTAGSDAMDPLEHTLTFTNQLQDVVGNAVENPGTLNFSTVVATFTEQTLTEDFTTNLNEDLGASGGAWGGGILTHGSGGGSGRLGPLTLTAGDILTLNTDSQVFPIPAAAQYPGQLPSIISNEEPLNDTGDPDLYDPNNPSDWPTVTIDETGEAFEFSEVTIEPGSVLILEGAEPGRIFSRGNLIHNGVLNLSGETPVAHRSNSGSSKVFNQQIGIDTRFGGTGGLGGPAAGDGGDGATRMNVDGLAAEIQMENAGAIIWPAGGPAPFFDGKVGTGVGGATTGALADAGGEGGVQWPSTLPTNILSQSADFGNVEVSAMGGTENCRVAQAAGPGGGGAYALAGGLGVAMSPFVATFPGVNSNTAPDTSGGDQTGIALEPPGSPVHIENKRNLEFWRGNLLGGSGGGGGGTSIQGSRNNQYGEGTGCTGPNNWSLNGFWDHSAAAGGGGGGALMLVAGRTLRVGGTIDCSGGDGGSANGENTSPIECTDNGSAGAPNPNCGGFAAPGGGGSGGVVRLQGAEVELLGSAVVTVEGGTGGTAPGGSAGGDGSPGLVRIEHLNFTNQGDEADVYAPRILPVVADVSDPFNNPFKSAAILSIGDWRPPKDMGTGYLEYPEFRPEGYSGSQSCWMAAEAVAGASNLFFIEDAMGNTDPELFGWNMDIRFLCPDNQVRLFPYRGLPPNDSTDNYDEAYFNAVVYPTLLGNMDFETYLGTTLNHDESDPSLGSYLVVRFQGVQATVAGNTLCDLDLEGPDVLPGSLTPFVGRPEYLNEFDDKPNLIRFVVIFDESLKEYDIDTSPNQTTRILGITNLRIRVLPQ